MKKESLESTDSDFFALISGDYNPLHIDNEYARTTVCGKRVVYDSMELVFRALDHCSFDIDFTSEQNAVIELDTIEQEGTL